MGASTADSVITLAITESVIHSIWWEWMARDSWSKGGHTK